MSFLHPIALCLSVKHKLTKFVGGYFWSLDCHIDLCVHFFCHKQCVAIIVVYIKY